jgi:hypothetical protein
MKMYIYNWSYGGKEYIEHIVIAESREEADQLLSHDLCCFEELEQFEVKEMPLIKGILL